ncbi:MAG: FAD-dependent oxidoreductase [Hyphomonadaceae bacterium]
MTRKHVIVIGAGFSGVAAAAALVRRKNAPRVTLIERDQFGTGLAYSTKDAAHLLNVRASNMSAYADKPDDFAHWIKDKARAEPTAFATRRQYGAYLQNVLRRSERAAMFGGGLKRVRGEAVACRAGSGWWHVTLASGNTIEANGVVLALGNQAVSPSPAILMDAGVPVLDPWDRKALQRIGRGDVLLLGAGLTMIDVALSLASRSKAQTIYALSRRGQAPRIHLDPARPAPAAPLNLPPKLSDALHDFRREVRAMAERGEPWQLAVDRMRETTPVLWRALNTEEQRRFLRHLRVWWDVHRHRTAPAIAERAQALQSEGRLRVLAGEVVAAEKKGRVIELYHRQRGSMVRHRLELSAVVNCTGANLDLTRSTDPLIQQMLMDGLARAHPSGVGLDLDGDARVLDARGQSQGSLYALGPITVGSFWESTAVPEIRARAAAIAALF